MGASHLEQFDLEEVAGRATSRHMSSNERTRWQCEVAALNKELTAVRQHMDWQAQRINELELRLNTLGVK